MPHSSAHVGHRHLPAAMMQQPAHPMRQQLQPVHMQPYMSADNLANQLAVQCQVAAGRSRMQHVLSPVSSGMGAAAVMPSAVPAAVSTAAYPPPGLQALQQVQASQPGLLQQHAHMLPQISSSAQGMGAPMAAACAGLSQASMQLVQLMPASGMQGMVPAKLNVLQDDGLAGPPACGYQPAQHIKNPLLLQNQVLPPNGYHNLPGMTSVGDLEVRHRAADAWAVQACFTCSRVRYAYLWCNLFSSMLTLTLQQHLCEPMCCIGAMNPCVIFWAAHTVFCMHSAVVLTLLPP